MLNKLKNTNSEGFTIIEVLIVLAIAGLILLIVFLAVPALQRNARNTSRKSDAGRLSSAVNNFVSNNNGTLPGGSSGSTWTTDCGTITNDAGSLAEFSSTNIACGGSSYAQGAGGKFNLESGAYTQSTTVSSDALVLDEGAVCPATSSTKPATTAGTPRQVALLYTVEPGSGAWNWNCIQAE